MAAYKRLKNLAPYFVLSGKKAQTFIIINYYLSIDGYDNHVCQNFAFLCSLSLG